MPADTSINTQTLPATEPLSTQNEASHLTSSKSLIEDRNSSVLSKETDTSSSRSTSRSPRNSKTSQPELSAKPQHSKTIEHKHTSIKSAFIYFKITFIAALVAILVAYLISSNETVNSLTDGLSKPADLLESNFVVIIDAGSTGSRVHVYEFNTSISASPGQNTHYIPQLVHETFELTRPGLSYKPYVQNFDEGAKSLDPLLKVALQIVPEKLRKTTPLALKATAGLRLIGSETSAQYIDYVTQYLKENYPFKIKDVGIMDGKEEAVYAWLTTNYLLEYLDDEGSNNNTDSLSIKRNHKMTAAVFDLGGASTQIVFEPDPVLYSDAVIQEIVHAGHGDHIYDMVLGGYQYKLYQHSHLGYGLMEARKKIHQTVFSNYIEALVDDYSGDLLESKLDNFFFKKSGHIFHLENPCVATGMNRTVRVPIRSILQEKLGGSPLVQKVDHYIDKLREMNLIEEDLLVDGSTPQTHSENLLVTMVGPKIAQDPEECIDITLQILNLDVQCHLDPCSFNGIHQPDISETFGKRSNSSTDAPLYIFSYFYDRTFPLGLPQKFPLSEFTTLLADVCQGPQAWSRQRKVYGGEINPRFKDLSNEVIQELDGRPEWCLDLAVMYSLLSKGYGIPLDREVTIAKKIHNHELGWCLGAAIGLLSGLEEEKDI
ncbi:uncharacterized protein SAPINGB_P002864 [Magnusiomyces paraingens]|uniref:guanosine-diphosphatase n=1 Tax=Magnusiomyces paraingens TaxID=2606893 RepID=A0A5E8BI93_9ASCO|nr:uncharacterized protein SAPINGB_P002864 [Saprochaete ingens]VVT50739.1 unnamed protein product [Saprochaete ingens]